MFTQYFGNYLLNKGLITPEQLADALDYQRSVHLKLGVLAVNAGCMTPAQVETVHNMQKKVDKKFGELSIELGYIDEEQLKALLNTQKQGHLMLGQALIDRRYFTLEQLQAALDSYKKESGMSNRQFNVIRQDDAAELENTFRSLGETLRGKTYADYVTLLIKNIIRFIDDNPTVEIKVPDGEYSSDWYVYQEIFGQIGMMTAIACENSVFIELASRYAGERLTSADELAQASVGEFLNLHNGIFLVNMSNSGVELEMKPQTVIEGYKTDGLRKAYIITCHLNRGKFDLIIS
jgi:CheY-specific phosphatase CheX